MIIWDKVFNLSQSKLRSTADGYEMTLSGAVHKAVECLQGLSESSLAGEMPQRGPYGVE